LLPLLPDEPRYICPGENQPITRAVHLSRLAAFYPGCRQCPQRHDTGSLPRQIVERIDRTARRAKRPSLMGEEGVRGVYLNEITRAVAERYSAAFASLLWDQLPLLAPPLLRRRRGGQPPTAERPGPAVRRRGPSVVLALDDRPAAPDLAVGAAAALRRMGCEVVDIGLASTPCLWFAVHHLQAAGGVYVTGHGCGPAAVGLDFLAADAVPWSRGGTLDALHARSVREPRRPTRQGGGQRTFRAAVPYTAGLWKHFHALRPLRIGMAAASRLVQPLLTELFAQLPCTVEWSPFPVADDQRRAADLAAERLADAVLDRRLHTAVLIAEDGQILRAWDEQGEELPADALCRQFAYLAREDEAAPAIVLGPGWDVSAVTRLESLGCRIAHTDAGREAVALAMRREHAALGAEQCGRYWFRDSSPACDGILTLAKLLQALSRSDAPASALRDSSP
jgi:phosphomannomutase